MFDEERPVPFAEPPGNVLARNVARRSGHVLVEQEDGYLQRIFGVCDFNVNKSLTLGRLSMSPSVGRGFASVLLAGNLVTGLVMLGGAAVLHAGAVVWDGLRIAVTGPSGAGKSTALAMMCTQGAEVLAEDALRLDIRGDRVWGYSGSHEIRLRPRSLDVASGMNVPIVATKDARYGLRTPSARVDAAPIDVVVIPQPSRECDRLGVEVLQPQDALLRLMSYPRMLGCRSAAARGALFRGAARLAAVAPVVVARLPWGPPFAPALGAELLASVESLVRSRSKAG